MSVLVTSISGMKASDGSQIAAFSPDEKLVGTGVVRDASCGFAVWGDDPTTEVADGLTEGEAFMLRLWDADKREETDLKITRISEGEGLVYHVDDFLVIDASVKPDIPDNHFLSNGFPNPFNALTRFTYGVTETRHVSLRIYDLRGRLIATLVEKEVPAGSHEAIWNGQDVPSGMYLVMMKTPDFTKVRKVMLIR